MRKSFLFLAIILTGFASCKKDLRLTPVDQISDAAVWTDPALVQTFVNNIYGGIPHGFGNINMGSIVDESFYNADDNTIDVGKSLITPNNLLVFDAGHS